MSICHHKLNPIPNSGEHIGVSKVMGALVNLADLSQSPSLSESSIVCFVHVSRVESY